MVGEVLISDLAASEGILFTIEVAPLITFLSVFIIAFEYKCIFCKVSFECRDLVFFLTVVYSIVYSRVLPH